ncbi:polyketide synthase [Amylocarpus encephaloides]|uniref:Polyketide synthase n=1 Tax=Amylocarpus encephaloides TaxID=45428 RepID=A0A9P7YD35_9HELO|nr:polyketide synthase [Amylocarpus encephaloides]
MAGVSMAPAQVVDLTFISSSDTYSNGATRSKGSSTSCAMSTPTIGDSDLDCNDSYDGELVCVVGQACRLPGGISSPSELWDFIVKKNSAQGPTPQQSFNMKGFYHPGGGDRGGAMSAQGGYFLQQDIRKFDNNFFGINNLETTYLDPQQRQLLEVVYECLENAGISMDQISDTTTGVYVGNFTMDYQAIQNRDPDYGSRYSATGSGTAILANRISHVFNLHGPSFALDTACSSSIYCVHNAVRAIQSGDCDGAIVAGVNVIMSPEQHLGTSLGGVLSPTSTCHTFDISADGYGRGEGINAVYLKRLSSALKDGDCIRAIIRGTAVNANGNTSGIAQPSATFQEAVIRKAYSDAALTFSGTDYVECHGTGTAVGDPIEVDALSSCFAHREGAPVMLGSIKTNLGHSEAASGLTSLIKVALSFENDCIPPTFGVTTLNPKLKLDRRNFKVVTEVEPWPRPTRRASINSFGFGGANAHLILESIDSYLSGLSHREQVTKDMGHWPLILPVSAASKKSLNLRIQQLTQIIPKYHKNTLERLAFTLSQRRSRLGQRDYLLVQEGIDGTGKMVQTDVTDTPSLGPLPIAFVFTGQGAQYAGMGKELLTLEETFATTIRQLDNTLQALPPPFAPDWTLEQTILDTPDSSQVNNVTRSQPLCTAIQIAIVNVLRSWGVAASAVVGHSSGEIAAAYTAGLLSATQAIIVAYFRGYAVGQPQAQGGAMMAVGVGEKAAESLIERNKLVGKVCVACVNSPESVTLSGLPEGIETLEAEIKTQGMFARKLETGQRAYHSYMMKEVGEMYEELLSQHLGDNNTVEETPLGATMYSSVGEAGNRLRIFEKYTTTTAYWRENLEKPVQFSSAIYNLIVKKGKHHAVEIGPHSALKGPLDQIRAGLKLDNLQLLYTPTLVRKQDSNVCMRHLAGNLFRHGHEVNWHAVNRLPKSGLVPLHDLPTYPWDYPDKLLWYEPRASMELRNREHVRHELLGSKQLAGDGINWCWRNILRLNEMPWIRGHKVEDQIIFPAAGYLGIGIEAISQVLGLKDSMIDQDREQPGIVFEFRNVNIAAALVVPEDNDAPDRGIELHTRVSKQKLSTVTVSSEWFEFCISSAGTGHATVHCAGEIRVNNSVEIQGSVMLSNTKGFETWVPEQWYAKATEGGFCLEEHFKSLTSVRTDGNRERLDTECTTLLIPPVATYPDSTYYSVHPITIDTCLQAPIIDSTLRDPNGTTIIDLTDVRLSLYQGKKGDQPSSQQHELLRHPFLRTHWKPDILRLDSSAQVQLDAYVAKFLKQKHSAEPGIDQHFATAGALFDLAGHKNPKLRVLEIAGGLEEWRKQWLDLLNKDTAFPRCHSWHVATISEEEEIQMESEIKGPYDVIYIPEHVISKQYWNNVADQLIPLLESDGLVLIPKIDMAVARLQKQFTVLNVQGQTLLAKRPRDTTEFGGREICIVVYKPSQEALELATSLEKYLLHRIGARKVFTISLDHAQTAKLSAQTICISLLEVERELLASMSQREMDLVRILTNTVAELLWLTGANMLAKPDPNLTMSNGLSRAIMLEQPFLRFSVIDLGPISLAIFNTNRTCENIVNVLCSFGDKDDKEFTQLNGLLHISRFVPDSQANSLFRRRRRNQDPIQKDPLTKVSPARLSVTQQICEPPTSPLSGFIDVDIKAVSLNAKDIYTINGLVETRTATTAIEFSGIVAAVGPNVELQPGDRVVVSAPNHFTTRERVPAWAAHKLLPNEEFTAMATLPIVYGTALYALEDRAHLRAGESVLIHAGAGALGIAMITIAQKVGAVVYTTVGSEAKRNFLIHDLGIPDSHIFSSRDKSFVNGVQTITGGHGVDVIINSLVGDLMHASWECVAQFGRFVEVGKRELVDAGKLSMHLFLRNVTFTAFDFSDLFFHQDSHYRGIWISKTKEVLELYRSGHISPVPMTIFDVADIVQAYRHFSAKDRIGKVVVSLESPQSLIPNLPAKYQTTFSPDKIYLLVGCLGGLGRSLSRWMLLRGARKFCFLGRSGCDKPSAQHLVDRLREAGATVTVVRGDVSSAADVTRAVAACTGSTIGGVVQAAMGLHEALFSNMTSEAWQTSVRPKWTGTWNLHNELGNTTLEFLLLMSSMSGSIGTATESNYCAANGFLDAFARWRRSQGQTAVSIGLGMISEVGYLNENPDIEALLLRRGIQPLNEDEFLQAIDMSLVGTKGDDVDGSHEQNHTEESHLLTGLEPLGYRKLMAQGYDVSGELEQDPRTSILAAALAAEKEAQNAAGQLNAASLSQLANDAPWLKEVPAKIVSAFASELDAPSLQAAVLRLTKKRFSNLILTPPDRINGDKPLSRFGVDSMIAAEFRTWFWRTFKVDIPFHDLLSPQKTLNSLAEFVAEKLDGAKETPAPLIL